MASVKNLKKDLNNTYGAIIDGALIHQASIPQKDHKPSEELIDDVIINFDKVIAEINKKDVDSKSKHLQKVNKMIESDANTFIKRLNAL